MTQKTALITGGARGIGFETAKVLTERGWRVFLADINGDAAIESAKALNEHSKSSHHLGFAVDVRDEEVIAKMYAAIANETDQLHGLVPAAGNLIRQASNEVDLASWESQISSHLTGTFLILKGGYELLRAAKSSSIVTIGSVGSSLGMPQRAAYSTAKSGMHGLTRTLAVEWGELGIRVNMVSPGYVDTEMIRSGFRAGTLSEEKLISRTPLRRLCDPREIGTAISFLLSEDASFVTGSMLRIDGGITVEGDFAP